MVRVFSAVTFALAIMANATPAPAQDLFRSIFGPPRIVRPAPKATPAPVRPEPETKAAVKVIETPPAYEGEMGRLAEILGALHYLRPLCGTADGVRWRNEMSSLIEAEQPPPERRDRLIASFNRSYVAYEQTYRSCTPAANVAIGRFIDEGAKLSREIATRYGN